MEGQDSTFDITYARQELEVLYRRYKSRYPSQTKKAITAYGSKPFKNRRWTNLDHY